MHPEIVRDAPGACPICGMALEPRTLTAEEEENPELRDMTRRFRVSAALTLPLFLVSMGRMVRPDLFTVADASVWQWVELLLATPVVLWGGWPFCQRAWWSLVHRSPTQRGEPQASGDVEERTPGRWTASSSKGAPRSTSR